MNLKKVIVFIVVSYGFTWVLWLPLLLNKQFDAKVPIISGQFYIASFGPFVGALVTSFFIGGRKAFMEWLKRAYSIRFKVKWLFIALTFPLFYGIVAIIAHRAVIGSWPAFAQFGLTNKLPGFNLLETALIWILTFGLGEESGWRGFLLPELCKKFSVKSSALIVSVIWILWHLPAFWFNENYMNMGFGIIGWGISLTFGSIFLAWLCDGSRFSVIPVLIWHGGFDLLTASDQAAQVMAMVCSMLVIIQGVYLSRRLSKNIRNDSAA